MPKRCVDSPLGPLTITETNGAITCLNWGLGGVDDTPLLSTAAQQLTVYFAGGQDGFDVPTQVAGSDFQRQVCDVMTAIPLGETRTYGEIADQIGASAQAVGNACGANPIPIIIPCHRVLGANTLGGFSAPGGVETKVWLLRHEKAAGLLI